jgi:hypothetical protein
MTFSRMFFRGEEEEEEAGGVLPQPHPEKKDRAVLGLSVRPQAEMDALSSLSAKPDVMSFMCWGGTPVRANSSFFNTERGDSGGGRGTRKLEERA